MKVGKKKTDKIVLSKKDKINLSNKVHELMLEGKDDNEIIAYLGIGAERFSIAKKYLLSIKGDEEQQKTKKERFAEYIINQNKVIAKLNDLTKNLNSKTQYNAIVGSLRLESDIYNKIIDVGQNLGIIDKEPEKKLILEGVAIANLGDKELRKGIIKTFAGLSSMIKKYGDGANIKDLIPGQLHYGDVIDMDSEDTASLGAPPIKDAEDGKYNKARSHKVSSKRKARK